MPSSVGVADDVMYVRDVGATAAKSPLHHVTTDPDCVVVIVALGAPVPAVVPLLAGVPARTAPVHHSTTIECQPAVDGPATVTVIAVDPATVAAQIVAHTADPVLAPAFLTV